MDLPARAAFHRRSLRPLMKNAGVRDDALQINREIQAEPLALHAEACKSNVKENCFPISLKSDVEQPVSGMGWIWLGH
jgi:hypothetical protein